MATFNKNSIEEQLNKLKEQKERKEQGFDYSIKEAFGKTVDIKVEDAISPKESSAKAIDSNPFVRKISLEELINSSRVLKGEQPIAYEKKTPFIAKEKDINTPSLAKK